MVIQICKQYKGENFHQFNRCSKVLRGTEGTSMPSLPIAATNNGMLIK